MSLLLVILVRDFFTKKVQIILKMFGSFKINSYLCNVIKKELITRSNPPPEKRGKTLKTEIEMKVEFSFKIGKVRIKMTVKF